MWSLILICFNFLAVIIYLLFSFELDFWRLDVSQTASYEITFCLSVCQSVCLSVCLTVCLTIHLSLSFLKIGSLLVFSDIVHDNRSPKYLVTEGVRFLKKKKKIGSLNLGPKLGFLPFSQIWFIIFSWNCILW